MNWFEKLFKKISDHYVTMDKAKTSYLIVTERRSKKSNQEVKEEIDRYNNISSTSYESNWVPPVVDDYSPPSYDFGADSVSSSDSSSDFGGYDGGSSSDY